MEQERREKNLELIAAVQQGDRAAADRLISENMGLVRSIARRFCDRGVEYEDLVEIGVIGMYRAIRTFDFSYHTAFSTYAVPLIIGELRRHLRDDGMIKVSRETKKRGREILAAEEAFRSAHMRDPTVRELAEQLGLTPAELAFAREGVMPVHSLSQTIGSGDEELTYDGMLSDRSEEVETLCDRMTLHDAVAKLSKTEQQVVYLRYYKDLSQQQTAVLLGLTQVKISRMEKKIFTFLRTQFHA